MAVLLEQRAVFPDGRAVGVVEETHLDAVEEACRYVGECVDDLELL